jgi:hypothetical protein
MIKSQNDKNWFCLEIKKASRISKDLNKKTGGNAYNEKNDTNGKISGNNKP